MTNNRTFYDRKRPAHQPVHEHNVSSRIIYLTVCADKRKKILAEPDVHNILVSAWKEADVWLVGKYMIMPDHVHLFCSPVGVDYPALKTWVNYWKSNAARHWPDPDVGKVWQRDFWDTQLRRGDNYAEKWNYVLNNPVRAGFVAAPEDWPYQGELSELLWRN